MTIEHKTFNLSYLPAALRDTTKRGPAQPRVKGYGIAITTTRGKANTGKLKNNEKSKDLQVEVAKR